jgi:hypothetical protein
VDVSSFLPADGFGKAAVERIQKERGRPVRLYWPMHRAGAAQEVAVVEFEAKESDRLASVVLVEADRLSYFDWPARIGDTDCWRVSDGCRFSADTMDIPIVLGRSGELVLVFTSWGEEGQAIVLLQARDGKLVELKNAYRYYAPI